MNTFILVYCFVMFAFVVSFIIHSLQINKNLKEALKANIRAINDKRDKRQNAIAKIDRQIIVNNS